MRPGWRPIGLASTLALASLSCDPTPAGPQATPSAANQPWLSEVEAPSDARYAAGQLVYVPAYSQVDTADNRQPLRLAATLFVRNVDPARPIVVVRVEYYDSGGKLIRKFLPRPIRVGPLASADFFVKESDVSGGTSPSFLVGWVATEPTSPPVVESVMIGTSGTQGISFTGSGRVVDGGHPFP